MSITECDVLRNPLLYPVLMLALLSIPFAYRMAATDKLLWWLAFVDQAPLWVLAWTEHKRRCAEVAYIRAIIEEGL